jgi:iron complex transport system ATP-binding protein
MICEVSGAFYAYPGANRQALKAIEFAVEAGEQVAIVGPNGAGKSTLLKLLTGLIRPDSGRVRMLDRSPSSWKRRDMARSLAVVSQTAEIVEGISVRDLVRLGRNPYVRPWAPLGARDERVVGRCLAAVDLEGLVDRDASTLSGGELQRARLARALAQEPRVLLLDEPTAHLDLGHESRFMELLQQFVTEESLTVIYIMHHLSTAARYVDRMVLMSDGEILAEGPAREVLVPELLERAFGWPVDVVDLGPLGLHAVPARSRGGEGSSEL